MKKICLSVVGIFLSLFSVFSQTAPKDSAYQIRPLKVEEVNLVSSYYRQDGNNSAVTGGIGTEKVTDLSSGIDVTMMGVDAKYRKHTLTLGLGIDHHTSASQAWVSKSGASKSTGTRIYPTLNWLMENNEKKTGFGLGIYYSNEYSYHSIGADINASKKTNNNGEITAKVQVYLDQVKLIYPSELRPAPVISGASSGGERSKIPSKARNTVDASLSFFQVINSRLQASIMLEAVAQNGYLGLPFHRVYFNNGAVQVENLPANRFKVPIGLRANYFLGDKIILRSFYRFYKDDWGLQSHTIDLETVVKLTPFFSVAPFYRFYTQTAIQYYADYEKHTAYDQYYTSNHDLSKFNSNFFGAGFRVAPPKGLLGMQHVNMLEIRYGHYDRNNGLNSDIISLNLKFK